MQCQRKAIKFAPHYQTSLLVRDRTLVRLSPLGPVRPSVEAATCLFFLLIVVLFITGRNGVITRPSVQDIDQRRVVQIELLGSTANIFIVALVDDERDIGRVRYRQGMDKVGIDAPSSLVIPATMP